MQTVVVPTQLELLQKLSKDVKIAARNLGLDEARALVDLYYQMQDFRIATQNQVRSIVQRDADEPVETIKYFRDGFQQLEDNIKKVLDIYTDSDPVGKWAKSIVGIGPVIAAGLIANLSVEGRPTYGHFWSYCGLNDNNRPWLGKEKSKKIVEEILGDKKNKDITFADLTKIAEATQWKVSTLLEQMKIDVDDVNSGKFKKDAIIKACSRPPHNLKLKILCWKLGESFVKVSNNPNDVYGKIYKARKLYEMEKNEKGEYAEIAKNILATKNIGKSTDAYKAYSEGKLPPAHIQARSTRYAVKIFLSHLHHVMYVVANGVEPPKPYALSILGHGHEIKCPNLELINEFLK